MRRNKSEFIPIRILNKKTGEVIDFFNGWSMRKAKNCAKGSGKNAKFTDLKVYRNLKNPFYE